MAHVIHRQVFVPLPLLRAIERLPDAIAVGGCTLRLTGEVTSAPIMRGFAAYRAFVECDGAAGWIDLSSASSSRTDMTLRTRGVRMEVAEKLVLALRTAMVAPQSQTVDIVDDRIDACRSA